MKTLIAILVSIVLTVSFSVSAQMQGHAMQDGQDGQMMAMMGNDQTRSMMMDQIAGDPEMRQEMMSKMMQSMDMQKMMSDPEMKARMQMHLDMMQAMLDSEGMDPAKMKEMMNNPEMMSMMKMHMMCAQTSDGGMTGEYSMENGEEHVH